MNWLDRTVIGLGAIVLVSCAIVLYLEDDPLGITPPVTPPRTGPAPGGGGKELTDAERINLARRRRRHAERLLEEPDIDLGNTFSAICMLREAVEALRPIRTKQIELYAAIQADLHGAESSLQERVDRAKGRYARGRALQDPPAMQSALEEIRRLVPDPNHETHRWARAELAKLSNPPPE